MEAAIKRLEKEPLCERRGFMSLAKLDSNLDGFPDWRFAVRGFLDREPTLGRRLNALEEHVLAYNAAADEDKEYDVTEHDIDVTGAGKMSFEKVNKKMSSLQAVQRKLLVILSQNVF